MPSVGYADYNRFHLSTQFHQRRNSSNDGSSLYNLIWHSRVSTCRTLTASIARAKHCVSSSIRASETKKKLNNFILIRTLFAYFVTIRKLSAMINRTLGKFKLRNVNVESHKLQAKHDSTSAQPLALYGKIANERKLRKITLKTSFFSYILMKKFLCRKFSPPFMFSAKRREKLNEHAKD